MGIFKKFRSESKPAPKSSLNLDSLVEASEFSLSTSQLSHLSQDTKRHLDLLPRKAVATNQLNRHLLQPRALPPLQLSQNHGHSHSQSLIQLQQVHLPQLNTFPQHQPPHPLHLQGRSLSLNSVGTFQNSFVLPRRQSQGFSSQEHLHKAEGSLTPAKSRDSPPGGLVGLQQRQSSSTVPTSPAVASRPVRVSHLASTSMLYTAATAPTYPDDSYTLASLAEASLGLEDERHPYYDQWKQYYAAMAGHKGPRNGSSANLAGNAGNTGNGMPGNPRAVSSGSNSNLISAYSSSTPQSRSASSNFYGANQGQYNSGQAGSYQNLHLAATANANAASGLVRNSRMSTLKLNRLSLVPSLAHAEQRQVPRAVSMNVDPVALETEEEAPVEETVEDDPPVPSVVGVSGLARPPPINTTSHSSTSTTLTALDLLEPTIAREDSAISDYGKYLFNTVDLGDEDLDPGVHAAIMAANEHANEPPVPPASHSNAPSRNDSTASRSSYNSLQSELNFSVGRKPSRIAPQKEQQRSISRKNRRQSQFVPPMPGPPPPIFPGTAMPPLPSSLHYGYPSADNVPDTSGAAAFQLQQMQQQIQQLQQLQQQQMQMYQGSPRHSRISVSPQPQAPPRSLDATINAKIEEFVVLRQTIAAGHKTFDFRLRWAKMLIQAVCYKLYAYVNIKGESIPSEQAAMNKLTFVKLAVTHLQKMLKELDVEKHTPQDRRTFAEVCYIHGCLLMHDYVPRFEQDFNIQQDKDEADRFFRKCLELNPLFFRAHHKLAILFEEDQTEEGFDTALYHYTQAAKLGYNRAIYQVAIIYLTVPKVRLMKYFKYLKSLSDIDMESKDIKLGPEDRDELEEISGLASFQLAKIYEGIYPGDLTENDEFVQQSLEIAPVNYAKSLSYYNRAARLHCLQAQVRLGHIYENGDLNRKHNPNKSIQWFIKAATSPLKFKRHPEAMLGLSRWFMVGTNGLSKHIPYPDPNGSLMWADRACKEFSFPEAFYAMGQLAEQGLAQGDPLEWYQEAYNLGFVEAATKLPGYVPPEMPEEVYSPELPEDVENGAQHEAYPDVAEFDQVPPAEDQTGHVSFAAPQEPVH